MSLKANRSVGVQHLVDAGATYTGSLLKFGSGKGTKQRYCVLHDGYFYYFKDQRSKTAKGAFCLEGYSAMEVPPEKSHKWAFNVYPSAMNKAKKYSFATGSPRERDEWILHINLEVSRERQSRSLRERGDGQDESDSDDSVKLDFSYDYAQDKPTDVSFIDPEHDSSIERKTSLSPKESYDGFTGPRVNENSPHRQSVSAAIPMPPPRVDYPVRLDVKGKQTRYAGYEVVTSLKSVSKEEDDESVYNQTEHGNYVDMTGSPDKQVDIGQQMTKIDLYDSPRKVSIQNEPLPPIPVHRKRPSIQNQNQTSEDLIKIAELLYEDPVDCNESDITDDDILPSSVYQLHLTREDSEKLLSGIGAIGLYLIRQRKDKNVNELVLSVYTMGSCRHYIIFQKDSTMFLKQEVEPKFLNLVNLIRYYMKNNLPTCNIKLSRPYKQ